MSPGFISEFLFIYSIIMTCIGIQITFDISGSPERFSPSMTISPAPVPWPDKNQLKKYRTPTVNETLVGS
jgi:hypothetical protein